MIIKVATTGNKPGGLLKYLMNADKDYELYGGNIAGTTYQEIMQRWRAVSRLNPRTDKDTKHIAMSPHHNDEISPQQWLEIGEYMVHGLGYKCNLWLMIKHKPTESQLKKNQNAQPHVHLMIHTFECETGRFNRVNDWQDKIRAEKLAREIENKWQLHQVISSQEVEYTAPTTGQCRRMLKEAQLIASRQLNPQLKKEWLLNTGLPIWEYNKPRLTVLQQLQEFCTEAITEQTNFKAYINHLEQYGISVEIKTKNQQPVGIVYGLDNVYFAGRQLGKQFSWTARSRQGMIDNNNLNSLEPYFREIQTDTFSSKPIKQYIQTAIDNATQQKPTLTRFLTELTMAGIKVKFQVTRNRKLQGISYQYNGEKWHGSRLQDASITKLQSVRGININLDSDRDWQLIKAVNNDSFIPSTNKNISANTNQNNQFRQLGEASASLSEINAQNHTQSLSDNSNDKSSSEEKETRESQQFEHEFVSRTPVPSVNKKQKQLSL